MSKPIVTQLLFASLGLNLASAKTLYPDIGQRPPALLSDFQKNNISCSWAPGHPKEWTDKDTLKFYFSDGGPPPSDRTSGAIAAAALSADQKFLVTANVLNHLSVIDFTTGAAVASAPLNYPGDSSTAVRVLAAADQTYDVLYSMRYQGVQRFRLSSNGTLLGSPTIYPGGLLYQIEGSPSISHSGRKFITTIAGDPHYTIYDLDNPTANVTISDVANDYFDASFSPDDQSVAVRGYNYYGGPESSKLFNTTTGSLIRDFGETSTEVLSISPDGKMLATSKNGDGVQFWDLRNGTGMPLTVNLPSPTDSGFVALAWSPDTAYLAVGTWGSLAVFEMAPTPHLVQYLELESSLGQWDVSGLLWLPDSKRLAYRTYGGLEIYDFESNLKYRWGFGQNAHFGYGPLSASTFFASKKGWIGGMDQDGNVRFYENPA